MLRKVLVLMVAVSAFLFLYVPHSGAADVIKLKFANYMPILHINTIIMGKFCDEVNKKLTGKVEITAEFVIV